MSISDEQSFASDPNYSAHNVFSDIDYYMSFYDKLSMSVLHFCTVGTKAVMNIDTYVYSSIQGTLESAKHVLKNGRIGDAYALLRKYYDAAIMNVYTNFYLEEEHKLIVDKIPNWINGTERPPEVGSALIVDRIQKWLNGTEQLPDYRIMSNYIRRESSRLKPVNALLYVDERYKKVRDRCNDSTHYNLFTNVLLNDNRIYIKDRVKWLDVFAGDLREIFILHLGYI
jgi:hypothetical protein